LAASRGVEFEVIVIDDGSTEPLEPIVAAHGYRYMRIDGPSGPASARNHGAAHAAGTHLLFVDSDVCVHEDTIARMSDAFAADPAADAVVGTYDDEPADTGFFSQYKNLFHHYVHQSSPGRIGTFWSGCGAMRREVFLEFGGFDDIRYRRPAIEDIELGTWVSAAGHRIVLDPRVRCKHLKRWTLIGMLKSDIFDRGIPWIRLMHRSGKLADNLNVKPLQRACAAMMYLALTMLAVAAWAPRAAIATAGLLAVVTAVNHDFYRYLAARKGWWFAARAVPLHWLYFLYCGFCVAAGTALHYVDRIRVGLRRWLDRPHAAGAIDERTSARRLLLALIALTLLLYGRDIAHSAGVAGDAGHHLINGIFIFDALRDPGRAMSDPLQYAFDYYRHFPAVNIGYYPPGFAVIEGLLMTLFGASAATGQLAVLLMAIVMTCFSFAWFRLRFDRWWAAGATALLMSTPILVHWGRDILLEIPALAFMIGSVWAFERLLRSDRPPWRAALLWALLTSLALWTKQQSLIVVGIFALSMLAARQWRKLLQPPVLVAGTVIAIAAGSLIAVTILLGGDAVAHTVGPEGGSIASRLTADHWLFYLRALPQIVTWPILILAALGLISVFRRREIFIAPALAWIIVFYVMHSYFVARDVRYGCFWLPPFCLLAVVALRNLPALPRSSTGAQRRWTPSGALMTALVLASCVRATQLDAPRLPTAYAQLAGDLADRAPPFNCLTFLPERPGLLASSYRVAVEPRRTRGQDIYSFGHIIRAEQALADWPARWPDGRAVVNTLEHWNVKYIVVDDPRPPLEETVDEAAAGALDAAFATGAYRECGRYPLRYASGSESRASLVLYEHGGPIKLHPHSMPTLRTRRIPTTIGPPPHGACAQDGQSRSDNRDCDSEKR